MQESARIALSYIKANMKKFGINAKVLEENDIHIGDKLELFNDWIKEITVISSNPKEDQEFYHYQMIFLKILVFHICLIH